MSDLFGNHIVCFIMRRLKCLVHIYNSLVRCSRLLYNYTYITGLISCNGQDGTINVGGASGGSIKLSTGTLNGKGIIKSNGGKGMFIFSTVKVIFTSFKFQNRH